MKRRKRLMMLGMVAGAVACIAPRVWAEAAPSPDYPCPKEKVGSFTRGETGSTTDPCGNPTCSITNDCNGNGIDDRCDASCLNTGKFCVGGSAVYDNCTRTAACGALPDCNNNDKPDSCDLANNDCNGNGVPDDCDADCNGNGVPDDCDVTNGTSPDINGNLIPDECEDCDADGIPDDLEDNPYDQDCDGDGICNSLETPDCNGNAIPDGCETDPSLSTFAFKSGELAPMDGMNDQQVTFYDPPAPNDTVTLTFEAVGDLDSLDFPESVRIHIFPAVPGCGDTYYGWCTIGNVFSAPGEGSDCTGTPDLDTLPVSADLFNAIIAANPTNDLQIWMDPGINVGSCVDSYIAVTVSYTTADDCDGNTVPDVCDPDCNTNGIPDACDIANGTSLDCNLNGVPDECDLDSGTSPDCNANAVPDECEGDCNANGVPDDCDIDPTDPDGDGFVSQDCDGSAFPDECEASADPAGSRYVEVTPGGFDWLGQYLDPLATYKIKIEPYPDGFNACNSRWVLDGGHLTTDPLAASEMTPDAWCTQYVHDAVVIPDGIYTVIAEAVSPPGESLMWNVQTYPFGDCNRDGWMNVIDILCAFDCYRGIFTETCTLRGCDQAPALVYGGGCAAPDGVVAIDDLLFVIDAWLGRPYPCPDPCFTGPPAPPAAPASPVASLATAETPHTIDAGGTVDVDVFVSNVSDLRAYELSVDITGGSGGSLVLTDVFVDEARADYAFYGASVPTYWSGDVAGTRVADVLESGGVDATASVYAATFRYQATSNANGTFTATASIVDSAVRDSASGGVGIADTTGTTIEVIGGNLPQQK